MTLEQQFLILNPVHTDRADDFEVFVREVMGPAVQAQQPELRDKVRLWKASEPEPGSGAIRGPRRGRCRPVSSTSRWTRYRCGRYGASRSNRPASSTSSPVSAQPTFFAMWSS